MHEIVLCGMHTWAIVPFTLAEKFSAEVIVTIAHVCMPRFSSLFVIFAVIFRVLRCNAEFYLFYNRFNNRASQDERLR
jgi:hypothetical protein